jgi:O-acetyl-ADP-ribose deacetylase (regulator of RNase III)
LVKNEEHKMAPIHYLKGDATAPQAKGTKIIAHVCNDVGKWGKGFVLALSAHWPEPERAYRQWYRERRDNDFGLGAVQFVQVESWIWVANMVGQRGVKGSTRVPPIRYQAVAKCLESVAKKAEELHSSVHMPRIGCGLAGGKWERIEPLILDKLCANELEVVVYDF